MKKEKPPYFPTQSKLAGYKTNGWECQCPHSQKAGKVCKHILAFKWYRDVEAPKWEATLSFKGRDGRTDCGCPEWQQAGECIHTYVLAVDKAAREKVNMDAEAMFALFDD